MLDAFFSLAVKSPFGRWANSLCHLQNESCLQAPAKVFCVFKWSTPVYFCDCSSA